MNDSVRIGVAANNVPGRGECSAKGAARCQFHARAAGAGTGVCARRIENSESPIGGAEKAVLDAARIVIEACHIPCRVNA